jgi:hypothetical protein
MIIKGRGLKGELPYLRHRASSPSKRQLILRHHIDDPQLTAFNIAEKLEPAGDMCRKFSPKLRRKVSR